MLTGLAPASFSRVAKVCRQSCGVCGSVMPAALRVSLNILLYLEYDMLIQPSEFHFATNGAIFECMGTILFLEALVFIPPL